MKAANLYLLLSGLLFLSACAPTRRLAPGQQLFEEATIQFTKPTAPANKKVLKEELLSLVRPPANNPIRLWVYNLFGEPKKRKGFKYWLKYKVGEPPVLFNFDSADRNRLVLEKYLKENGYLNSVVRMDTLNKAKKVKAVYEATANNLFRLNNIFLPEGSAILDQLTRDNQKQSFLKTGQPYQAENLRMERSRLATLAAQNGYFGVTANDVYYYIDTTGYADSLDLYVRWKPDEDSTSLKKYWLGRTFVYPSYSLAPSSGKKQDTTRYQGLSIIEDTHFFKESLLRKAIRGEAGDLYDGRLQTSTFNYLQDLDVFKFINLQTETRLENGRNYLDRTFYLTPSTFRSVRFDFETNTRSGSYLGILTAANFTNKNWLGGAENLAINLSIGGETQLGNQDRFINTLEITAGSALAIPKLLLPFSAPRIYRDYVARTRFSLSNTYQIRTGFFTINRLAAQMAYDWRANRKLRHLWTPLSITQSQTFRIDPDFQKKLDQDSRLKNSLENVLILGGEYQFTYSTQDLDKIQPYFYGAATFGLAGNIPSALAGALGNGKKPYGLGGSPFSQFAKIVVDTRYYLQRRTHTWANRLTAGIVAPYGNLNIAPYSEQFFVGGSNSMRAFQLRELGPGAYVNPDFQQVNFFDQTGDIMLELNTEYRFGLFSYLKGAVFADAGNIWLLNQSIGDNQEGQFEWNSFLKEIAIGAGLGLRADFDYFVIRVDAAFPVRKPILNKGFEWTLNQLDFLNKQWRSDNLVWHLAIGYPF